MQAGFVCLSPRLDYKITCPNDGCSFPAEDWAMPGAMTMAGGTCPQCKTTWWTDLPYGLGFLAPTFIDVKTGKIIRPHAIRLVQEPDRAWAGRGAAITPARSRWKSAANSAIHAWSIASFRFMEKIVDAVLRSNQLRESGMDVILLIPLEPTVAGAGDHCGGVGIAARAGRQIR